MGKNKYTVTLVNGKTQQTIQTYQILKNKEYIIGRSQQADITIKHDTLSRKHAILQVQKKQLQIQDLGSVNGTYVDGQQIKENQIVFLKDGLNLYFGECEDKLTIQIEKQKDSSEESNSDNEQRKQKIKEKKQKKDKNQSNSKSKSSSKSRSRSRSQSKEKKQQKNFSQQSNNFNTSQNNSQSQDQFSKKLTPGAKNLQFGNQKADLTSKFGKNKNSIDEKRKLLWGNKNTKEIPKDKQLWNKLDQTQATGVDKLKFMKLMGVKNAEEQLKQVEQEKVSEGGLIMKSAADTLNQKESVNDILEKQYNKSVNRRFMGKGGLGN